MDASEAIALIEAARAPGDLFGGAARAVPGPGRPSGPDDGAAAARIYRRLARLTHPDARPGDARAAAAFARLATLWQGYGAAAAAGALVARGDLANLYRCGARGGGARGGWLHKVARDPADNDLIDREAAALALLRRRADPRLLAYFPELVRVQRVTDPATGAVRHGHVIAELAGFASLAEVRSAFPAGVDPRDAAWMWRRLLVAIGAAHRAGLVHGAVLPEHVLIHPRAHGVVLIDWCYSGKACAPLPALVRRYQDWYPPEIAARGPAGPDADIWLAAACMSELTGDLMPSRLAAFVRGCQVASPRGRPHDAWELLAELDELLGRLYGPRTFRPFAIPARGARKENP